MFELKVNYYRTLNRAHEKCSCCYPSLLSLNKNILVKLCKYSMHSFSHVGVTSSKGVTRCRTPASSSDATANVHPHHPSPNKKILYLIQLQSASECSEFLFPPLWLTIVGQYGPGWRHQTFSCVERSFWNSLLFRGGDLGGLGGRPLPKKFEVGGRPMHPSPQYFEK